jgi:uncharacterized protein HemY
VCAEATACFAVLSESINQARTLLQQRLEGKSEIGTLIGRLQNAEKDKLNYTAALHYEQIRSHQHAQLAVEQSTRTTHDTNKGTPISSMLLADVRSLKQQICTLVEEVNEVLEELRFAAIDEED